MSTTSSTPPSTANSTDVEAQKREQYLTLIRYTSYAGLTLCPILAFLPPRTPVRTSILIGMSLVSANHVAWDSSGEGLIARAQRRVTGLTGGEMPNERSRIVQERLKQQREARQRAEAGGLSGAGALGADGKALLYDGKDSVVHAAKAALDKTRSAGPEVVTEAEADPSDWKTQRDRREKEALEQGKGYGDLIMDQIWEVWSWGGKKAEELKEKDEEVVEAKESKK